MKQVTREEVLAKLNKHLRALELIKKHRKLRGVPKTRNQQAIINYQAAIKWVEGNGRYFIQDGFLSCAPVKVAI